MPKVSIIVPCYNVELYLDRCVYSLVNQTLRDIEIILVDDESPDNIPQMCDEWGRTDSRIRVVHKKNGGLGMACNSGIDIATGDYIAFCDSDDYVDLECYEVLYKTAILNKVDAVYSGIKRVSKREGITIMSQAKEQHIFVSDEISKFQLDMISSSPSDRVERHRQMSAKTVLYSGAIIRKNKVRFHSERQYISEDLLFNLDFLQYCSRVIELPQSYYYYCMNASSLSQKFRFDRFEKYKLFRNYLLSNYEWTNEIEEAHNRINKLFIGYTRGDIQKIVKSKVSFWSKWFLLSRICNDDIWSQLAQEYPVEMMPKDKKLIFELIRFRLVLVLYILFKLKK